MELNAEKEEYLLEIVRLKKILKEKTDAFKQEKQNLEWEKSISVGTECKPITRIRIYIHIYIYSSPYFLRLFFQPS